MLLQARARGLGGDALARTPEKIERLAERVADAVTSGDAPQPNHHPTRNEWDALVRLLTGGEHSAFDAEAKRLMDRYPGCAQLLRLVGAAWLSGGRHEQALTVLERADEISPGDPATLNLLGVSFSRHGRHEDARLRFDQSLSFEPSNHETLVNASSNALEAGDVELSLRLAKRALQIRPDSAAALLCLGNALAGSGRAEDAEQALRRAAELKPQTADVFANLGRVLIAVGKAEDAVSELRRALSLSSDNAVAHLNLGLALHHVGQTAEARRHFRIASSLRAAFAEAHSAYLFSLVHDGEVTADEAFEEHLRVGELIEAPLRWMWREHDNVRDPQRELRIGFVSGDLRHHPVADLIEPVWAALRTGRNRLYAYAQGTANDDASIRLREMADEWIQTERMSDDALSERIRSDRIDILFDLAGHSARNRLPVFARKPAPVQISWIGYPGTTGLTAIDYRFVRGLGDKNKTMQALFRERLVQFSHRGFQPASDAPDVKPLPALQRGFLTFGSFNRPSKIGDRVISLWSRVLAENDNSRLIIAGVTDESLRARLTRAFGDRGIDPARLSFRPRVALKEYLGLHNEVDIALDTFPYSGGTTTIHALWMGVPTLTLEGNTLQQNQAAAMLRSLGLSDWIAASEEQFVRQAIKFASDISGLSQLRFSLREEAARRFRDSRQLLAAELESALRRIWRHWCEGKKPESFVVDA